MVNRQRRNDALKSVSFDVWNNTKVEAGISRMRNEGCETCGPTPTYPAFTEAEGTGYAVLCGRDTVQVIPERDVH